MLFCPPGDMILLWHVPPKFRLKSVSSKSSCSKEAGGFTMITEDLSRFLTFEQQSGSPKKGESHFGLRNPNWDGKQLHLEFGISNCRCLPYVLLVASWTVLDLWTYTFDHLSRPRIKLKAVKYSIETSSNHPQRQPRINNPLGSWKMGGYHWSIRLSLPAGYPLKYPIINRGLWIWLWHYRILFHNSQPSARRFQILQSGSIWTFANPSAVPWRHLPSLIKVYRW